MHGTFFLCHEDEIYYVQSSRLGPLRGLVFYLHVENTCMAALYLNGGAFSIDTSLLNAPLFVEHPGK